MSEDKIFECNYEKCIWGAVGIGKYRTINLKIVINESGLDIIKSQSGLFSSKLKPVSTIHYKWNDIKEIKSNKKYSIGAVLFTLIMVAGVLFREDSWRWYFYIVGSLVGFASIRTEEILIDDNLLVADKGKFGDDKLNELIGEIKKYKSDISFNL